MTAGARRTTDTKRIVLAADEGASLVTLDLAFIRDLVERRHLVYCIAEYISEADQLTLAHAGAQVHRIDLTADRLALLPDRQVTMRLFALFKTWAPDVVIARGRGVMEYVTLAARKAGAGRIVPVQQRLPFDIETSKRSSSERAEIARVTSAFDAATDLLTYNYDHMAQLEVSGLLPEGLFPAVLPWPGVDLKTFAPAPLPDLGKGGLRFLMITELARSSGVLEFCRAAQLVRERAPQTHFTLAGPASRASDALSVADLAAFQDTVTYAGDGQDRANLISACHVFVYPAYGETPPVPAMQALAMGRPVVVADAPGCRELADERVNGCYCAPADAGSLAEAMRSYLKRPDLIPAMSRASRQKAERRFDQTLVIAAMRELIGLDVLETAHA